MSCKWTLAVLLLLLAFSGCGAGMTGFYVPAQAWAGEVFEIVISGSADGNGGGVVAILQLPNGFAVEGAIVVAHGSSYADQAVLGQPGSGLPAAEPGHFVTDFSGGLILGLGTPSTGSLKVYVLAPQAPGAFTLKALVCGDGNPTTVTSFANVTGPPIAIVANPVTPFVIDTRGLVAGNQTQGTGVAFGDLDGDGMDDLAYAVGNLLTTPGLPPGIYAWLSRPGSAWLPAATPPSAGANASSRRVALGDFDGDGHLDLADSAGRVLFGNGGTAWASAPALPLLIPVWSGVAVGDIDGDGFADVAFCTLASDAVQVFRSNGNRTFTDWSNGLPSGTNGPTGSDRIALQDVNGDGVCDIVASGPIGLRVWLGNGSGTWTPANQGLPTSAHCFAIGDLDRNGIPDLVVNSPTLGVAVLEFTGNAWQQRTMPGGNPAMSGDAQAIAVLDYDRDGWPDVAYDLAFVNHQVLLLRNLSGQSFSVQQVLTALPTWSGVLDFAVGDIDGDSWPDLAAAMPGEHPIIWHNTGSGLSPFGSGCGAVGFATPRTTAIGQPTLGNSAFAFELQSAPPNAASLLWLGLSRRFAFGQPILPFDLGQFGAPGCVIVASQDAVTFVVADALGRAQLPLPIPNVPAFARFTLFAQSAALAPGANSLGLLVGNGLAAKIP